MVTNTKFSKKKTFNGLKDVVISDIIELWIKGSLPTIEAKIIHKKLKMLHQRFEVANKLANSLLKIGWRSFLTCQNASAIF